MACQICGKYSSFFQLCKDCNKEKENGNIEQCKDCGKWYIVKDGCKCTNIKSKKETNTHKENNEERNKRTFHAKEDNYASKAIIKKETETDDIDIRKKWEAVYQCDDGHYVRSYSEVLIDNWLYNNDFVHSYEKSVFMPNNPDEKVLSDFYIPKGKVYIEFWGIENKKKYANRKEIKINLYKNNNYNLINLYPEDIKNLNDNLPRLLHEFLKK